MAVADIIGLLLMFFFVLLPLFRKKAPVEGKPRKGEQALEGFLKALSEDWEEALPPEMQKSKKKAALPPPPPARPPKEPVSRSEKFHFQSSLAERSVESKVEERHLETAVNPDLSNRLLSAHFQRDSTEGMNQVRAVDSSSLEKQLQALPSSQSFMLMHELLSAPKALREESEELWEK